MRRDFNKKPYVMTDAKTMAKVWSWFAGVVRPKDLKQPRNHYGGLGPRPLRKRSRRRPWSIRRREKARGLRGNR
jgi:hypothetical protein